MDAVGNDDIILQDVTPFDLLPNDEPASRPIVHREMFHYKTRPHLFACDSRRLMLRLSRGRMWREALVSHHMCHSWHYCGYDT